MGGGGWETLDEKNGQQGAYALWQKLDGRRQNPCQNRLAAVLLKFAVWSSDVPGTYPVCQVVPGPVRYTRT